MPSREAALRGTAAVALLLLCLAVAFYAFQGESKDEQVVQTTSTAATVRKEPTVATLTQEEDKDAGVSQKESKDGESRPSPSAKFTIIGAADAGGGGGASGAFASMVRLGERAVVGGLGDCESLCSQAPACLGFVFHRTASACTMASNLSTNYKDWKDDSTKDTYVRFPDASDNCTAYRGRLRTTYEAHRGKQADYGPNGAYKEGFAGAFPDRAACEAKCEEDAECRGIFWKQPTLHCVTFNEEPGGRTCTRNGFDTLYRQKCPPTP